MKYEYSSADCDLGFGFQYIQLYACHKDFNVNEMPVAVLITRKYVYNRHYHNVLRIASSPGQSITFLTSFTETMKD